MGRWSGRDSHAGQVVERHVHIPLRPFAVEGALAVPEGARQFVLFAHGTTSARFGRRHRAVAETLQAAGIATLRLDLLTSTEGAVEGESGQHRFDVELLAGRLLVATDWLADSVGATAGSVGYFAAGVGSGVALIAAAERSALVGAVVCRGGRADLAGSALSSVRAPTLLIVGADDPVGIIHNERARACLGSESRLAEISSSGPHFEEEGAIEEAARLANVWFSKHLRGQAARDLRSNQGAGASLSR